MTGVKPIDARAYTPADRDACLAVFDSNVPAYFTMPERRAFEAFLSELPGPYIVLRDAEGSVVACGGHAIVVEDGGADLCWGMVRQDLHGTGIGRALTEARLAAALADPAVRYVALNTSQHTTGFYERLGFTVTEVVRDGFAPGLDRCEMRMVAR